MSCLTKALRVDKKHFNSCFKNSETTLVPPISDMTKTLSNVQNLSIAWNFQCYKYFHGTNISMRGNYQGIDIYRTIEDFFFSIVGYISTTENFRRAERFLLLKTFRNMHFCMRWPVRVFLFGAEEEHCLIESNVFLWRVLCGHSDSQTQSWERV